MRITCDLPARYQRPAYASELWNISSLPNLGDGIELYWLYLSNRPIRIFYAGKSWQAKSDQSDNFNRRAEFLNIFPPRKYTTYLSIRKIRTLFPFQIFPY